MEDYAMFITLVSIVSGVLVIILSFKVWGMTNDVRKLTDHFCNGGYGRNEYGDANAVGGTSEIESKDISVMESKDISVMKSKGVTYEVKGSKVIYSDGTEGYVKKDRFFPECTLTFEDGSSYLYSDTDSACKALYEYLTLGTISKKGACQ